MASASARIVDGVSGTSFTGVVPAPSVGIGLPEGRALQAYNKSPLSIEAEVWRSVGDTLSKAAEEFDADPRTSIEFSGKVHGTLLLISLDPMRGRLLLRHEGRASGSQLELPWPPSKRNWTVEQSRASRTFSNLLVTSEACGSVLVTVRGRSKTHVASLVDQSSTSGYMDESWRGKSF